MIDINDLVRTALGFLLQGLFTAGVMIWVARMGWFPHVLFVAEPRKKDQEPPNVPRNA